MSDPYGDEINDDQTRVIAYINAMIILQGTCALTALAFGNFTTRTLDEKLNAIQGIIHDANQGNIPCSILVAKVAEMRMLK